MATRTGRADTITEHRFHLNKKKPGHWPGFLCAVLATMVSVDPLLPNCQKDMDTVAPYSRERPTTEKS